MRRLGLSSLLYVLSSLGSLAAAAAPNWEVVWLPDDAATRGLDVRVGDSVAAILPEAQDVWSWRRAERLSSIKGGLPLQRWRNGQTKQVRSLSGRSGEWLALPASDAPRGDTDPGQRLRLAMTAANAQQPERALEHYVWLRTNIPEQELEITLSLAQFLPALVDQPAEQARLDALLKQAPHEQLAPADAAAFAMLALLRAESALRLRDCMPVPDLLTRIQVWSADTVLHAQALLVSAQCRLRARDYPAAKRDLDQAEQILTRVAPGSIELAILQGRRAVWLQMQRQFEPARSAYASAIQALSELSIDHVELARWHFNMHLMALEHRQLADAEREARAALAIFGKRQPNSLMYYQALAGVAEVLSRRAEFQQAVSLLAQAVRASDQTAPWTYEALSLHVQYANALHQAGSSASARRELDTLLLRLDAPEAGLVRQNTLLFADALQYRATFAARHGDCDRALTDLEQALAAYRARRQQGAGVLTSLLVQAECRLRLNHIDLAAATLSAATETADALAVQGLQRASLLHLQAALAARQAEPERAEALDDQALDAFEAHRASVGGTPLLRALWADQYRPLYQDAMARAADRNDITRLSLLDRRYRFQALLSLLDLPDVEAPKHWLAFLRSAEAPASTLQPHQAMLRWLVLPEQVLVLIDRAGQPTQLHRLPISAEALQAEVDRYLLLGTRALRDPRSLDTQWLLAEQLYQHLLQPLATALQGSTHWILIADGPLQSLPWAALVTRREPEPRFLVESVLLSVAPSSDVWMRIQTRAKTPPRALALGDPILTVRPGQGLRPMKQAALQPLPGARVEAEQVAARYGQQAQLLLGNEATERAARAALPEVSVAHFALHSVLDQQSPMDSYIALAPGPDADTDLTQDGRLSAQEVLAELRLRMSMVVLSACASARGRELAGNGVLGLGSAFQAAGADAVVASLWPISDAATAILMPDLHQAFAKQQHSAEALAHAQRAWLAAARDQSLQTRLSRWLGWQQDLPEQPLQAYYWAAFTVSGGR